VGVFQNHLMAAAVAKAAESTDFYDYQIDQSCRLNEPDDAGFNFTMGTPTDTKKWTMGMWLKRSVIAESAEPTLFQTVISGGGGGTAMFQSNDTLRINRTVDDEVERETTAVFRDVSAWMQIVFIIDTTQGTAGDRVKIYQNGTQITSFGTSNDPTEDGAVTYNTSGNAIYVGRNYWADSLGGYIAQVFGIDGQDVSITDFGTSKNGVWIPNDLSGLTFGNNGFLLDFAASGDMGNDVSGNNNDFSVSDIAASDQTGDSPTFNSTSNGGNFCTINSIYRGDSTTTAQYGVLSEGNLKHGYSGSADGARPCTHKTPASGKWYFEYAIIGGGGTANYSPAMGIMDPNTFTFTSATIGQTGLISYDNAQNRIEKNDSVVGTYSGSRGADGDVMGIAVDMDNGAFYVSKNGTFQTIDGGSQGDPTSGASRTGAGATWTPASEYTSGMVPMSQPTGGSSPIITVNFGQEGTFGGTETAGGNADGNGYGNFFTAPPSDYVAICTANLTTVADPAEDEGPNTFFAPKIYTGDGASTLAITGLEFQPDWTWIKNRDATDSHCLFDSSRGVTKLISSDDSAVESTDADTLKSWTSDGFTVGADVKVNTSSEKYVSWNWKVNGGTTASNSDGDKTSTVQVDDDRGISIVQYTGNETAETIGHGLSAAPELIMVKCRSFDRSWAVQLVDVNNTTSYILNTTGSDSSSGYWNNTSPTSSVFSVGGGTETNKDGQTFVAYCFVSKEGFSKIETYEGNGDADGSFVYTGFRPAWIMTKSADSSSDWQIFDDLREGYNVDNDELIANDTTAEATTDMIDILSNGFKCRIATDPNVAETYVFAAFAKNPFKYALAR
jgi:hypothetical protein